MSSNVHICLLGDKLPSYLPHKSAEPALVQSAAHLQLPITFEWVPSGRFSELTLEQRQSFHAIWAGSGPYKNEEGAIEGIRFAREQQIPLLGTCSGFKLMVWELAKNVLKEEDYRSYISPIPFCSTNYRTVSLRILSNSVATHWYTQTSSPINETTHCTFEITPFKLPHLKEAGIQVCAVNEENSVKCVSLANHVFYAACLFLPQLSLEGNESSQLIDSFILAAMKRKQLTEAFI